MRFLKNDLYDQCLTGHAGKLSSAYFRGVIYVMVQESRCQVYLHFLITVTIHINLILLVLLENPLYPKN